MRRTRRISSSVPNADFKFLHNYAHEHGMKSRSVAIHAIRLLRALDLGDAYQAASQEWEETWTPSSGRRRSVTACRIHEARGDLPRSPASLQGACIPAFSLSFA